MKKLEIFFLLVGIILLFCGMSVAATSSNHNANNKKVALNPSVHAIVSSSAKTGTSLIQPSDIVYQGAFRLPSSDGWEYGGSAMAYYPKGDTKGTSDGFPGSLYITGHDWYQQISEITIPKPVKSAKKNVNDLNQAKTLQKFTDIKGNMFGDLEIPRVGLEYLPKQGYQKSDKLYFCWGQHMQEGQKGPTHGWFDLNLANPHVAGPWKLNGLENYVTNGYIFSIPKLWADKYTPKMLLGTGRFRDGGQGSCGPSLFAYGPWNQGNPPRRGVTLKAVPLLLYDSVYGNSRHFLKNYHHSDEWTGGAWLNSGSKSSVIFVGTKGTGKKCWYGFADGTVWPDQAPYPSIPAAPNNDRGWWSKTFQGQIIFYDSAQLAKVAQGKLKTYQPQPYATLNLDPYMFNVRSAQQKNHVKGVSFDRAHGTLFVCEPFADGDKLIIHVWKLKKT